jgi:hypothetical protein
MVIEILCSGRSLGHFTPEFVGSAIKDVADISTLEFVLNFNVEMPFTLHHTDGSSRNVDAPSIVEARLAWDGSGGLRFVPVEGGHRANFHVSLPDTVEGIDAGYSFKPIEHVPAYEETTRILDTARAQLLEQLPRHTH